MHAFLLWSARLRLIMFESDQIFFSINHRYMLSFLWSATNHIRVRLDALWEKVIPTLFFSFSWILNSKPHDYGTQVLFTCTNIRWWTLSWVITKFGYLKFVGTAVVVIFNPFHRISRGCMVFKHHTLILVGFYIKLAKIENFITFRS